MSASSSDVASPGVVQPVGSGVGMEDIPLQGREGQETYVVEKKA